ncbi:helicase-related protein, partial [Paenibacillus enshidis]
STSSKKAIIFVNSRSEAELTVLGLRQLAAKRQERDIFHVHHGSLSTTLRNEAETALKAGSGPAVTAATLTLELGIDLGELDRVVQLGAPQSASSFVQRLGRTGRRKGRGSEMVFACA